MESQVPWVVWYVVNRCNLHCTYCFTHSSPHTFGPLDTTQLLSIAHKLGRSNAVVVTLEGGEPLIVSDLPLIVNTLANYGKKVRMYTNGIGLSKLFGETLPRMDRVTISFDDVREDKHNEQRGGYKQVVEAIEFLSKQQVPFGAVMMVTPRNYDGIFATGKYLISQGCKFVSMGPARPVGRGISDLIALDKYQSKLVVEQVLRLHQTFGDEAEIKLSGIYDKQLFISGITGTLPSCMCGEVKFTVNYDGFIYPCSNLPYVYTKDDISKHFGELPNLLNCSLEDAYNSPLMKNWREVVYQYPYECNSCTFRLYCNSGCRALNYQAFDSFEHKDPNCHFDIQGE
ncbi:MAG: Radical SAM domain protein [Candidatus Woesebacteria bacterium GW2011_GWB1_38_5b]|uniref:Radical SAM domain protein n=1 Tax=Candidatus Woesebacteria bacterium GW2011_GWB1_38_5b TaxID=1618569 RepID=A0A0G0MNW8_9BACT|nr:MAG: Radical SAM domain protein [Candidatus Woesebacteria bacterium GW2011_GWB1_38_5b]